MAEKAFRIVSMVTRRGSFSWDWIIIGPEQRTFGASAFRASLRKKCDDLNEAYELGLDADRREEARR